MSWISIHMGNSAMRIFHTDNAVYMDFQEYSFHKRPKTLTGKWDQWGFYISFFHLCNNSTDLWYSNLQFNVNSDFPVTDLRDTQKDPNMHKLGGGRYFPNRSAFSQTLFPRYHKLLLVCGYALQGKTKLPRFGWELLFCFRGLDGQICHDGKE